VRRMNSVSHFTRYSKLSTASLLAANALLVESDCIKLWRKSRASDYFNWRNSIPCEHRFKADRNEVSPEGDFDAELCAPSSSITLELSLDRPELGPTITSRIKSNFPHRDFWTGMAAGYLTVAVQHCSALFHDSVMWRKVPKA
jgi:hypothetical protein